MIRLGELRLTVEREIKRGRDKAVELVRADDGTRYIRRTYADDKRELFRAVMSASSSRVPRIFSVELTDDTVVVEQFIDGELLRDRLEAGPCTRGEVMALSRQLFAALSDIWRASIVHRDVKPSNIIIDASGRLYLIDFDIARISRERDDRTSDTTQRGTRGYASPEQYGFGQTDARSDIYSAGRVVLDLCASARLGDDDPIVRFARRCSALDPNERFKDADNALAALASLRTRRLRIVAACVAAVLLLCAAVPIASRVVRSLQTQERAYRFYPIPRDDAGRRMLEAERWMRPVIESTPPYGWAMVHPGAPSGRWSFDLGDAVRSVDVDLSLDDEGLCVALTMSGEPEQRFRFDLMLTPLFAVYPAQDVFGEVIAHDIDRDGVAEVFVVLGSNTLMLLPSLEYRRLIDWSSLYCIKFSDRTGFTVVPGQVDAGEGERIYIDPLDMGVITLSESGAIFEIAEMRFNMVSEPQYQLRRVREM